MPRNLDGLMKMDAETQKMLERKSPGNVIIRQSRIKVLPLAPGDAEHEKGDTTENRQDDDQEKENRPTGGVATALDHADTAGGTREK